MPKHEDKSQNDGGGRTYDPKKTVDPNKNQGGGKHGGGKK